VRSIDPQTEWDDNSSVVLVNLFEGLVRFDRHMRLGPGLALRWINPDEHSWRFFLDPAARFQDGSPVRAADVVASVESLRERSGSMVRGLVSDIERVEALDDLTVQLRTREPVAILNNLAFVPVLKGGGRGRRPDELPVGTGPYRVAAWQPGVRLRLEASPQHPARPSIAAVEFEFHTEPLDAAAVLRARPDLALSLRLSLMDELRRQELPGLRVVMSDGLAVFYLALNTRPRLDGRANPLADLRVRQALELATGRREIAREGLHGFGQPAWQLVVPQVFGYDPAAPEPAYDPARARRLLSEAGQAGLSVRLSLQKTSPDWLEQILARQWAAAGIGTSVERLEAHVYSRALGDGAFAATVQGYGCTTGDVGELLSFILRRADRAQGLGNGNLAGYAEPEVDRIADRNLRVFDPRERLEMLQRALRLASRDLPYVPLYSVETLYLVSRDLEWTPPPNDEVRVAEMRLRR
jgi:peptide/nickel transport system substrate-binding protein